MHYYELLKPRVAKVDAEDARVLAALFSGSPASAELLLKHPDWIQPEAFGHARRAEGMRREIQAAMQLADPAAALAKIRLFKLREMVRIAARDLSRLADLPQTVAEISAVADVCISGVLQICREQMEQKYGRPYHLDAGEQWQRTDFAVVGLGKLGGQELNYSSDVDVVFVYSEEGFVFKDPPKKLGAPPHAMMSHQFFKRLAEMFVAELTRQTADGSLFRIDVRLRPEGDSGPLVRSLSSYETYYAQWGQAWERMMLIKARGVAGDASLAAEFTETVQPFRYPRSLSEGFLREIAAMKDRIEAEVVKAGEIDRNVKLGRGGIREIEFAAQSLQVIHGGRLPFLQTAQTLTALEKLVQYHLLDRREAEGLRRAYCFLRDLEHRLQMENYLQTHTIPPATKTRERLARLLGFKKLGAFERALKEHTQHVRRVYDQLFKSEQPESPSPFPRRIEGMEGEWKAILAEHSFREPERCLKLLAEFVHGPGFGHVSPRTMDFAWQLVAKFLSFCPKKSTWAAAKQSAPDYKAKWLSDPDRVLTRLDSFIAEYGSRALLFETWSSNPLYFELILLLFDRSEFLAETAIRTPDLVDALVVGGRLRRRKSAEEILSDLQHGRHDEDQTLWLRRYHQAELMRIGLRDILGLADFEQNLAELSALAEACLQYALEAVLRKHQLKSSPFIIIGLGKLGGNEISYGSDLDVIFVADHKARDLRRLQKIALEVLEMISGQTALGVAFPTDTRLRPDGEKGLVVNTLRAYEEYYRHRAQLWEIQALSRYRPVAGNSKLGQQFARLVSGLTGLQGRKDWKKQIAKMRQRIEKERTPPGQDALAIKTGSGGLMDAEFVAQTFCLEQGVHEPNTLRALERARDTKWLLPDAAGRLIDNYKELRRIEGILRRWSYAGETVLPTDPAPQYRVAVRCGWRNAADFLKAVAGYRRAIRSVFLKVFA
jgi:glutamate-ammonia-ligase adenylyltransferase